MKDKSYYQQAIDTLTNKSTRRRNKSRINETRDLDFEYGQAVSLEFDAKDVLRKLRRRILNDLKAKRANCSDMSRVRVKSLEDFKNGYAAACDYFEKFFEKEKRK